MEANIDLTNLFKKVIQLEEKLTARDERDILTRNMFIKFVYVLIILIMISIATNVFLHLFFFFTQ